MNGHIDNLSYEKHKDIYISLNVSRSSKNSGWYIIVLPSYLDVCSLLMQPPPHVLN